MPRFSLLAPGLFVLGAVLFGLALQQPAVARADISGVYASEPTFEPGQPLTITVTAEDDDGTLDIVSNLDGSELTVSNCSGVGSDQVARRCDGAGLQAVSGQGSEAISIATNGIDSDDNDELLTVTLTLIANCDEPTTVTIAADQPGNHGPDDVTVNCVPPAPTPTPSPSPTPTSTSTATPTVTPPATTTPMPTNTPEPAPTATLVSEVLTSSSSGIRPPSTGSAGLR